MSIKAVLAGNIRRLRKARGWTQAKLAETARISNESVQKYERQRRWPEYHYIQAVAKALGCTEADLFRDVAPMDNSKTRKALIDLLAEQEREIESLKAQLDAAKKALNEKTHKSKNSTKRATRKK